MRRQVDNTSCLDVTTLRSARAMLNCTEVSSRHRNGWTGYTKVYDPGFAQRPTRKPQRGTVAAKQTALH